MKNVQNSQADKTQTLKSDNDMKNSSSQNQSDTSGAHLNKGKSSPGAQTDNQAGNNQRSNISVDNEGRIGQQDQWNNIKKTGQNSKGDNKQVKNEKSNDQPEIDAPIYEPEKTERKIPRMEEQTKNNK